MRYDGWPCRWSGCIRESGGGRYGEEVRDLLQTRPVRVRTLTGLVAGAADARARQTRGSIPGFRIPAAVILIASTVLLWGLWNPGVRDVPSLERGWALAAAGDLGRPLAAIALWSFTTSGALGGLALLPLATTALKRRRVRSLMPGALLPVVSMVFFGETHLSLAFLHNGFPVGPMGDAITGGFFIPPVLAAGIGIVAKTRPDPGLARTRLIAKAGLAFAALLAILSWGAGGWLVGLGAARESGWFITAVAVSAAIGVAMCATVIRAAWPGSDTEYVWLSWRTPAKPAGPARERWEGQKPTS